VRFPQVYSEGGEGLQLALPSGEYHRGTQGWGKIRPIRIRIRIREYSANSNFENDGKVRRIRIRIQIYKFEFALANSNSNRIMFPKFANIRREFEFAL
jgi:hypothetical protein